MRQTRFLASAGIGAALICWAFATNGKEGLFIFFAGVAVLACSIAVAVIRQATVAAGRRPVTNLPAIVGAVIGLFLGGFVGARSGLGRVMIDAFNPSLPEQDFGQPFGAIGGALIGAFVVALLGGIMQYLLVHPHENMTRDEPTNAR